MILPGLTLSAMEPLWIGSLDRGRLTEELTSYSHTINALGGYWSMSFKIAGDERIMEDWIADGLGRHVVLHDDALVVAWEGFAKKTGDSKYLMIQYFSGSSGITNADDFSIIGWAEQDFYGILF